MKDDKTIKIVGDGISERIYVEHSGISGAGFWIGVGIVIAAAIMKGVIL